MDEAMSKWHDTFAMPFGKHKGEVLPDIPRKYLDWLMEQDWFHEQFPRLVELVRFEFEIRDRSHDST